MTRSEASWDSFRNEDQKDGCDPETESNQSMKLNLGGIS